MMSDAPKAPKYPVGTRLVHKASGRTAIVVRDTEFGPDGTPYIGRASYCLESDVGKADWFGWDESEIDLRYDVAQPAPGQPDPHATLVVAPDDRLACNPTGGMFLVNGRWQNDLGDDLSKVTAIWPVTILNADLVEAIHKGKIEVVLGTPYGSLGFKPAVRRMLNAVTKPTPTPQAATPTTNESP